MRIIIATFVAGLLCAGAAVAQTPPAPAPSAAPDAAPAAAPAPAAPSLTKDGKPRMKDVRANCKAENASLKGPARQQAMADCMIKARPDKAAAIKCRMDPANKGLDKDARKSAVQACIAKAKG